MLSVIYQGYCRSHQHPSCYRRLLVVVVVVVVVLRRDRLAMTTKTIQLPPTLPVVPTNPAVTSSSLVAPYSGLPLFWFSLRIALCLFFRCNSGSYALNKKWAKANFLLADRGWCDPKYCLDGWSVPSTSSLHTSLRKKVRRLHGVALWLQSHHTRAPRLQGWACSPSRLPYWVQGRTSSNRTTASFLHVDKRPLMDARLFRMAHEASAALSPVQLSCGLSFMCSESKVIKVNLICFDPTA